MTDDSTDEPIRGRCAHCKQTRALFRYETTHGMHLGANQFTCRWCTRDEQPLLCGACWSAERILEETHPDLNEEAETLEKICAANSRAIAREAAEAGRD